MASYIYVKVREGREVGSGQWTNEIVLAGDEVYFRGEGERWVVRQLEEDDRAEVDFRAILTPKRP